MISLIPITTLAAGDGAMVALTLAAIAVLGAIAQWVSWKIRVPSILLLLLFGFLAGPGSQIIGGWLGVETPRPLLDPNALFGDLLLPLVGIAVSLILYEGGLTLKFREIRGVSRAVTMLVSAGAVITWVFAAAAAEAVLGLERELAVLLGAILIVTGPTVVGPMLQHIRPSGQVGPILKWEGIVIDPVGAVTAVLVLEVLLLGGQASAAADDVALAIVRTLVYGFGLGFLGAFVLVAMIDRFLVPEHLQNPLSLTLVIAAAAASNYLQAESGLLAATVMGIALANQKRIDTHHILEFKENLRTLLISILFIVLAARLDLESLRGFDWLRVLGFLAILILVVRPAAVGISTAGLKLSWPEKALLCLVAPRGIVAAAVASVFTLALANAERFEDPDRLVALTFFVIVGTVSFYGIAAPLVANWLGVSDQDPQGVLFVGAGAGSRVFAESLHKRGHRVLLVDTNREHVIAARMLGLDARFGNVLEEPFLEGLDLRGIGRVVAATPNEEVNALALQRFTRLFGRAATYAISRKPIDDANLPEAQRAARPETHARGETPGRVLLEGSTTLEDLREKKRLGWIEHAVRLGPDLGWPAYQTLYGGASILLYVIEKSGRVQLATADRKNTKPRAGDTIVALVDPDSLLMGPLFEEGQPEGEADPAGGR